MSWLTISSKTVSKFSTVAVARSRSGPFFFENSSRTRLNKSINAPCFIMVQIIPCTDGLFLGGMVTDTVTGVTKYAMFDSPPLARKFYTIKKSQIYQIYRITCVYIKHILFISQTGESVLANVITGICCVLLDNLGFTSVAGELFIFLVKIWDPLEKSVWTVYLSPYTDQISELLATSNIHRCILNRPKLAKLALSRVHLT